MSGVEEAAQRLAEAFGRLSATGGLDPGGSPESVVRAFMDEALSAESCLAAHDRDTGREYEEALRDAVKKQDARARESRALRAAVGRARESSYYRLRKRYKLLFSVPDTTKAPPVPANELAAHCKEKIRVSVDLIVKLVSKKKANVDGVVVTAREREDWK